MVALNCHPLTRVCSVPSHRTNPGHCCRGVTLNLRWGGSQEEDLAVGSAGSGAPACLLPSAAGAPVAGRPSLAPVSWWLAGAGTTGLPPGLPWAASALRQCAGVAGVRDTGSQRRGRWEERGEPWGASWSGHPSSSAFPLSWRGAAWRISLWKKI